MNAMENAPFAEVRETHAGVVLLYGDRAYKTKKPVVTDFLDFGTAEARERACRRELELNRRLAPDVYLGIAHLSDPQGGPSEPVLVMRRMPDARRLATMLAEHRISSGQLSTLATTLARFHATARRGDEIDRAGTPQALRRRWHGLLHSRVVPPADPVDAEYLTRTEELAMRFIDGRAPLLAARIAAGRMVDGHGDLLAEDIFVLPDGFRILDCLDFDDELRHVDCLDDAAFLAMDMEFRGRPLLAEKFLDDYLRAAADAPPAALRHHYIAYRAMVRAKTDRIRAGQGDPNAPARARDHLKLAVRHLERGAVRMVLVGGLPGTGKSTVARQLAARTDAELISTDKIRAGLRAAHTIAGAGGHYGAGAYSDAARALVYDRLLDLARNRLGQGVSVILDASWLDAAHRERAAALAAQTHAELIAVHCECPREVAAARIGKRPHGDSEATPAIADAMAADAAPWPEASTLDTDRPISETIAQALQLWGKLREPQHR
ncbi:bifunctional aminoglycoside phosphotransferase/ATP-binding protein [Nocardia sp. IFM 10818]